MKSKRFLLVLDYIILALFPCILYINSAVDINNELLFLLAGCLGIISYTLFCLQFLIASRPKLIDKYFSLDRLYRFHMVISVLAILLAYFHKLIKESYFSESTQTQLGDISLIIFGAIIVFSILMMINRLFFKVSIIDMIRRILNNTLKLKYETKVLIHNLTIIGVIVIFIHVLMSGSASYNVPLKIVMVIYFIIPLGFYFNHKVIKVYLDKNKKYLVSDILHNSSNIITIKFTPMYWNRINYLPGQFLYLKIYNPNIPNDEHPFTISSSPLDDEYVSVTIKQLGDFTSSLGNLKIGDKAYIDGGFGSFSYLNKPNQNKLCFIAGGVGITPFLSMLRYMTSKDRDNEVVLFWGVRDTSEIICKKELESYSSSLKEFKFIPVVSNDESYKGEKGFIDSIKIQKYIDTIPDCDFYICGPPVMLEAQLKNLKILGVKNGNIHFERFSY